MEVLEEPAPGKEFHVLMRVEVNGSGSELPFTLLHLSARPEEAVAEAAGMAERDRTVFKCWLGSLEARGRPRYDGCPGRTGQG